MIRNLIILIVSFLLYCPLAEATVVKELTIESVPSGVEAYLLQGSRRVPLGKTPLTYEATFHSEISIIRIAFEIAGYETKIAEVSATQDKVSIILSPRGNTLSPAAIKDPNLRKIQQRIKPTVDKVLLKSSSLQSPAKWEIRSKVRVANIDGKNFIILPIGLIDSQYRVKSNSGNDYIESLLRDLWDQLGKKLVIPLFLELREEHDVIGIILDIAYDQSKRVFRVDSHVESKVEMECVPGTETTERYENCAKTVMMSVYDYGIKAYRMESKCVGGIVTQYINNPCLYKVPVTRTDLKVDPIAKTNIARGKIQYVFKYNIYVNEQVNNDIFKRLGIVVLNEEGFNVIRRGPVPSTLPTIP